MLGLAFLAIAAVICIVVLLRWRSIVWRVTWLALALWCVAIVAVYPLRALPPNDLLWVAGCAGLIIAANLIVALAGPPDPSSKQKHLS